MNTEKRRPHCYDMPYSFLNRAEKWAYWKTIVAIIGMFALAIWMVIR